MRLCLCVLLPSKAELSCWRVQVYDVFRSAKNFSPKAPGAPVARICIAGPAVPTIFDMLRAERESPDVPVKWAICRHGTVSFQGFEHC